MERYIKCIGDCFGLLYKLCKDFERIENDIKKSNKYSLNFVVNEGVHETFILFMDIKTKLIEQCMILNIHTHTLKEVLDELEKNVDNCLKSSSIDMKSQYSSFSK